MSSNDKNIPHSLPIPIAEGRRRSGSVSDATRQSSSLFPHPSPVTKFEEHDDAILAGAPDDDSPCASDVDSEIATTTH